MTRSLHKIITLSFLSLYALPTLTANMRPSGSYFPYGKKETTRHEDELTWQETQALGTRYMLEVNYKLRERSKNWTQTPTCRSEKELENVLAKPWIRSKTGMKPGLAVFDFITAKKLTEKFANRPYSAAEIRDTVADAVHDYHPHFNKKHPVTYLVWATVEDSQEEIARRVAKAREMAATPPSTRRTEIRTTR